jgi:hypothetical protein
LAPLRREPNGYEGFQETEHLEKLVAKKQRREARLKIKKEQGEKPCSENCVDPFVSPKIGFDLD